MTQADDLANAMEEIHMLEIIRRRAEIRLSWFVNEAVRETVGLEVHQTRTDYHSTGQNFKGYFVDNREDSTFRARPKHFVVTNEDQAFYADAFPEAEWPTLGQAIRCANYHYDRRSKDKGMAYFVYDDQGRLLYKAGPVPLRWGKEK